MCTKDKVKTIFCVIVCSTVFLFSVKSIKFIFGPSPIVSVQFRPLLVSCKSNDTKGSLLTVIFGAGLLHKLQIFFFFFFRTIRHLLTQADCQSPSVCSTVFPRDRFTCRRLLNFFRQKEGAAGSHPWSGCKSLQ